MRKEDKIMDLTKNKSKIRLLYVSTGLDSRCPEGEPIVARNAISSLKRIGIRNY